MQGAPRAISVVVRVRPLDVNPQKHLQTDASASREGRPEALLDPTHANVLMLTEEKVGFSPVVSILASQQRQAGGVGVATPQLSLPTFTSGAVSSRQWPTFAYDRCFGPSECFNEYRVYFPLTCGADAENASRGGESNAQEDVFRRVGMPALRTLFKGFNASVIAYGQTGSGKTYSMFGPADIEASMAGLPAGNGRSPSGAASTIFDHPERGLIIRVAEALFAALHAKQEEAQRDAHGEGFFNFEVTCSFYQIYQEKAWELLSPATEESANTKPPAAPAPAAWSSSTGLGGGGGKGELAHEMLAETGVKPLRLRSSEATGPFLEGLLKVPVKSPTELVTLLQQGMRNRQVAATHLNMHSSRSHALCSIGLKCRTNIGFADANDAALGPMHRSARYSKSEFNTCNCTLHLVDLAGSERVGMLIGGAGDAAQYSKVLAAGGSTATANRTATKRGVDAARQLMKSDEQRFKEITDRRMLEASDINKSLSALGKVIHALATSQQQRKKPKTMKEKAVKDTVNGKRPTSRTTTPQSKASRSVSAYSRNSSATSLRTPASGASSASTTPRVTGLATMQPAGSKVHIPYRDSLLTHLLKDCFGGNSSTIMLATLSPMLRDAEETLSTLRFSSKARTIENVPVNTTKKMRLWSGPTAGLGTASSVVEGPQSRLNSTRSGSQSVTPRRRELRDHRARLLALENAELQENLKLFRDEILQLRCEIARLSREVELSSSRGPSIRDVPISSGNVFSAPHIASHVDPTTRVSAPDAFTGTPLRPRVSVPDELSPQQSDAPVPDEYEILRAMADRLETTELYVRQVEAEAAQFRRTVGDQEPQPHRSGVPEARILRRPSSSTPPRVRYLVKDPDMCDGEAADPFDPSCDSSPDGFELDTGEGGGNVGVWLEARSPAGTPRRPHANSSSRSLPSNSGVDETPTASHQQLNQTLPPMVPSQMDSHRIRSSLLVGLVESRPQTPRRHPSDMPVRAVGFSTPTQSEVSDVSLHRLLMSTPHPSSRPPGAPPLGHPHPSPPSDSSYSSLLAGTVNDLVPDTRKVETRKVGHSQPSAAASHLLKGSHRNLSPSPQPAPSVAPQRWAQGRLSPVVLKTEATDSTSDDEEAENDSLIESLLPTVSAEKLVAAARTMGLSPKRIDGFLAQHQRATSTSKARSSVRSASSVVAPHPTVRTVRGPTNSPEPRLPRNGIAVASPTTLRTPKAMHMPLAQLAGNAPTQRGSSPAAVMAVKVAASPSVAPKKHVSAAPAPVLVRRQGTRVPSPLGTRRVFI